MNYSIPMPFVSRSPLRVLVALVVLCAPSAWAQKNLLKNGDFSSGLAPWQLDRLEGAQGEVTVEALAGGGNAARVEVTAPADVAYHVQLFQGKLPVEAGRTYRLKFRARGVPGARIGLNLMVAEDPWTNLWKEDVELTPEWREFSFEIVPAQSSANARVTFTRLAAAPGEYWFADVTLEP